MSGCLGDAPSIPIGQLQRPGAVLGQTGILQAKVEDALNGLTCVAVHRKPVR